MFVEDVLEIKRLIINNIQLTKIANKFQNDPENPSIENLKETIPTNIDSFPLWYTFINSLYSSISLVNEFVLNKNDDLNDLDKSFAFSEWKIKSCYQHDDKDRKDNSSIDLSIVIRRIRNSISHGKFKIDKSNSIASFWNIEFFDTNYKRKSDDTKKNFYLALNVTDLVYFLERIEESFSNMYP